MNILLTGSTGFIGRRLAVALRAAGHTIIDAHRHGSSGSSGVDVDFTRDTQPADWLPKLIGVDAVVNAVGILREHGTQTFETIHTLAPQALFAACTAAGVDRIVQISALGADQGSSAYFRSKRQADEYLSTLPLDWTIVQPALVFGIDGTSARLFTMMASLPLVPLPGLGQQRVQPIHIDDLIGAISAIVQRRDLRARIPLVGPEPLALREFLARLRHTLGLSRPRFLTVPMLLMRVGAFVAQISPRSLLDRESLAMLEAGNTADPAATRELLGRSPRSVDRFVDRELRPLIARQAELEWLLPLLRWSLAAMWIWTGIVSLGLFPRHESLALLSRTGITGAFAEIALYGAAALDLTLGVATVLMRRRRFLWLAQAALIIAYTAIITIKLPEFWLHPYGPILKNLPILACIVLLYRLERHPWNTSS